MEKGLGQEKALVKEKALGMEKALEMGLESFLHSNHAENPE